VRTQSQGRLAKMFVYREKVMVALTLSIAFARLSGVVG
jgi:hypothetical protein